MPQSAAAQPLTPQQIDAAIAWGRTGQPEPYPLRSAFAKAKTPAGAVFTPFLRVALAARFAMERGEGFDVNDVTAAMIAPLVYVAIPDEGAMEPLPADVAPSMRLVFPHSPLPSGRRAHISPTWLATELAAYLRGDEGRRYLVAGFSLDQLRPGTRVELRRAMRKPNGGAWIQTTPGLITAADLASWR